MVQEILKNIDLKVDQELLKISSEKEKAVLDLEKKYSELREKEKLANMKEFELKIRSQAKEELQKKKAELEFAVLKEKNKIIEKVYLEAEKRIISLPDEEFKKLILSFFPSKIEGKIKAGKRTAAVLRGVVDEIEEDSEEGFTIIGNELDLDFRVSELLRQFKEKRGEEVIKMLSLC